MNKSNEELGHEIERYESLVDWGGWAIIAGLGIEVAFGFLSLFVFEPGPAADRWVSIGASALIAFGVWVEIHWGGKSNRARKELQTRAENKLAEAIQRASDAGVRAAEANEKASKAELELAKFRMPRSVTEAHRALIAGWLRPFSGTIFDTGLGGGSGEQADFLWQLVPALTDAGWLHAGWSFTHVGQQGITQGSARPISGQVAAANVEIHLHPETEAELKPAAEALISALDEIGIAAALCPFNTHNANPRAIHVLIGDKR